MATQPRPLSRAEVATRLQEYQEKINSNARTRTAFLKDPAGALRKQGIELSADRERQLNSFLEKQLAIPNAKVGGAVIRPGDAAAKVEVEVTVKVRF